ncbi:MAG: glycosyltransferase family 39 protein [Candidatus Rokubacteria bacterium]|nr:glycosyltransferase family 39 protein [Candidatus Rokubacteria bacterium]
MTSPRFRPLGEWALVGAVFAVLVAVAAVWLAQDQRPPEWDHANHLERVVACAQDLARGDLRAILERSAFYPPLVICTAAFAYRLAPSDVAAAQAIVLAFLGLGMGAVYVLGRRVAGGAGGVVAAVLFGSAPFVVFSSLRFQLDLPLASMVALALVVLLRAEGFSHSGWSVAAGVVLGLGMLTKPPFVVYVLPALVLVAARIRARRGLVNLGLAALIAAALALPWYGPRLFGIAPGIAARSFRQAAESGHPDPLTAAALALYPTWFLPQFGLVAVLLFAVGLVVGVRRGQWLLLASVLVPLALFMLIQNKNLRYTLPLLPVAAVLAGVGFSALPQRLRTLAGAALLAVAGLQVSATTFGVPPVPTVPGLGVPFLLESAPMRANWRHREILARIVRESGGAAARVSVVPNDNFFSVSNFRYYAVRDGLPLGWVRAWDGEPVGIAYMILKTGDQGPPWTAARPRRIAERLAADPHLARVFPVIGEFPLPDGSVATVRARRISAGPLVSPATLARGMEQAIRRSLTDVARRRARGPGGDVRGAVAPEPGAPPRARPPDRRRRCPRESVQRPRGRPSRPARRRTGQARASNDSRRGLCRLPPRPEGVQERERRARARRGGLRVQPARSRRDRARAAPPGSRSAVRARGRGGQARRRCRPRGARELGDPQL